MTCVTTQCGWQTGVCGHAGARGVASSEATPNFSNAMVAFCLIVPLMLTGVHFGK